MGLQHADELKSLFEGITATGRGLWGPSRGGLGMDDMFSSTYTQQPRSPKDVQPELESVAPESPKGKRRKENPSVDANRDIQAIIKTLAKADGPTIEECNHVLYGTVSITADIVLHVSDYLL